MGARKPDVHVRHSRPGRQVIRIDGRKEPIVLMPRVETPIPAEQWEAISTDPAWGDIGLVGSVRAS